MPKISFRIVPASRASIPHVQTGAARQPDLCGDLCSQPPALAAVHGADDQDPWSPGSSRSRAGRPAPISSAAMGLPTTVQQLLVVLVAVLPGVVFQFVRERSRGRFSGDDNFGERVLRAVVAGLVLDAVYLLVLGTWLTDLLGVGQMSPARALDTRPREIALVAVLLLVIFPAVVAWSWARVQQRRGRTRTSYQRTGSAWAYVFARRDACFVRIRLGDGTWVGGWYGGRSLASSHPGEGEIFLESSWRMDSQGRFLERVTNTAGVLVRADAIEVLEFVGRDDPPELDTTRDGSAE
jgi:hypothetical protein